MSMYLYEAMDRLSVLANQASDIIATVHEQEMPPEAVKKFHKAIELLGDAYQLTAYKWWEENDK